MSDYNKNQLDRIEPAYMASLGLQQAPFTSAHEDKFLYLDAERDQCDNMLHHLTQYSNLLLIVTGDRGMGKTSLLQHFKQTSSEDWSLCEVQANAMMDAHQLLASIAQGFGLQVSTQPAHVLQETLYQYLATIQRNGQIPILLVDDAHELPKDSLETLFTLADTETGEDNLLRIILFCEPQIDIMLESPAIQPLRERITHTIDIPAFSEEQTAEYIKHRMAVSGFTGTSPFQPKDIKKIYKVSQGIPARINELAHLHLNGEEYTSPETGNLPDEYTQLSFSKKRLAIGIVVISAVVTLLLFQDKINKLFEEPETNDIAVIDKKEVSLTPSSPAIISGNQKTIELSVNPATETAETTKAELPTPAVPLTSKSTDVIERSPQPVSTEKVPVTSSVEDSAKVEEPVTPQVSAHIRGTLPNPVIGSKEKQTILVNGEGFSKDTRITVGWSGRKKQLDATQVIYENSNQLRIQITVGTKADNWTLQANDPETGLSNLYNFKVAAAPIRGLQTISWINQQNPSHVTLQLLGTYNKSSLVNFATKHKLEKDTAFFITQRENRNWYTLVHGRFNSKLEAEEAVRQLPTEVQKTRPWIRHFADIQSSKTSVKTPKHNSGDIIEISKPVTTTAKTLAAPSLDLTANAAWLWSQNPGHYTLQLLGSHRVEALRAFTQKHQLTKQTTYYRTRRDNKEWFVLLYGSYPEREQAKKAINQLPAALRESKPWIRRFSDVHGELSSQ